MGSLSKDDHMKVITKSFVQNALEKEGRYKDGFNLLSYSVAMGSKPGDNYTSLIYTIDVELKSSDVNGNNEGDEVTKRSLIVKSYPNHPGRQEFSNRSNIFHKEMEVYSKWIPDLVRMQKEVLKLGESEFIIMPYASFVHGECVDYTVEKDAMDKIYGSLDNFVMMEDIKKMYGFRMTNRRESLDIHHMRLVVAALAKVHSLSWAYKHHVEPNPVSKFPCLVVQFSKDDLNIMTEMVQGNLTRAATVLEEILGVGNELSKSSLKFRDECLDEAILFFLGMNSRNSMEDLLRVPIDSKKYGRSDDYQETPWKVICHGDCWSNNMMFRYDDQDHPIEVILLDLQMPSEGCVIKDLQYVVYASTNVELRKNHLDSLLKHYHDEFNKNCATMRVETLPGFTFEELKYRFQRSKALGFYLASMGMPIMLQEEDKAVNLEHMDKDQNANDIFAEISKNGDNAVYRKRLLEVTTEMYEEGII